MRRLFERQRFVEFGPSRFHPPSHHPERRRVSARGAARLRERVRAECPRVPGVYGMLDADGVLVYVGKAKVLRARLMSYFCPGSRDGKAGLILRETRTILWEPATSEFAALLRELELIRRFLPRFNVQGKPGSRRYAYVCLGRAPAPYAFVSRELTGKELGCYGPIVGRARAEEAARRLNDLFRLRDCSQKQRLAFSDQKDLFPVERSPGCLRYEIGTCSGACVGGCSQRQYRRQVEAARAFLDGRDLSALEALEREMLWAAEGMQFERAAAVRDRLEPLRWLADRLTWLRQARDQHSFVYPLAGTDGVVLWYLIHRGQVRAVTRAPGTPEERAATAELIEEAFRDAEPVGSVLPAGQVDSVLLVAGWFRKFPQEREGLLSRDEALARCRGEGNA